MKKIIFIGTLLAIVIYAKNSTIKPNKQYTLICNDKIVDVNFAKDTKHVLYDSSQINGTKPLFNMGINYCKINNTLYLSAGETFKYNIDSKTLTKSFVKGDLLTCLPDKKILFYKKENKLYEYDIEKNASIYIANMKVSNKNWLDFHRGISLIKNSLLFFNNKEHVYKYNLLTKKITHEDIQDCNVVPIHMENKLLCSNRNEEEQKPYFFIDIKSGKKEYIALKDSRDAFYDKELNGIFYTRYAWDVLNMKEYRPSFFYDIEKNKEYFFSKECHF